MELGESGCVGPETVYVTQEDSPLVMSEKVQSLAGSIYQEFEKMIARYDEDVVKSLMPLLVNVLECLDAAYQQNQEHDVELELLREDNEQLVKQYEREKSARKVAEQKLLEFEDSAEGERKELVTRLESLESIVRMLELKHKNSLEHAGRLEEREGDLKKEFSKLHERYTELFKTHVDYMERTKILLSGQQLANEKAEINRLNSNRLNIVGRSSGPMSFGFASLENAEIVDSVPSSPISSTQSSPSLRSEAEISPKEKTPAEESSSNQLSPEAKSSVTSPTSPEGPPPVINVTSRIQTKKEHRSGNTLYEELTFQDADAEEDSEITGGWVHPGDYASSVNDNFYGMGKEVENLIMENNELLATKNALNVVKDDLIAKVDELTGEQEMLREEILSLKISRTKLKERVSELEEELKKVREANEARIEAGEDNSDVPMAQRKRFTRVEMARVLMERNQYKERFMELQDALRWTEMIRAQKGEAYDKKQSQGIWRFFNKLFNGTDRPTRANIRYQNSSSEGSPRALTRAGQDTIETEMGTFSDKLMMKRAIEKRDQYRNLKAHVRKEDGRMHAYGWSLPGKTTPATKGSVTGVPVPIPVYCRPLTESSPEMNVWCAAGVTSMEGYFNDLEKEDLDPAREASDDSYDEEMKRSEQKVPLSSQVWICSFTHTASIVTIIDANNPAEILDSFGVCTSRILCIASVPAVSSTDNVFDTPVTCSNLSSPIKEDPKTEPDDFVSIPTIVTEGAKQIDKDAELQEEKKYVGKIYRVENEPSISRRRNSSVVIEEVDVENTEDKVEAEESKPVEEVENVDAENKEEPEPPKQDAVSSRLSTMWIGTENGSLYVHSAVAQCRRCLHSVKLRDTIMSIVHLKGQVVVALACGMMAVFKRDKEQEWDLSNYYLVQVGLPQQPIRCLQVVEDTVWCGYRNKIHVLQPNGLKIIHSIEAHPRTESLVRHMVCLGVGVWVSIRLDSTLRLYHAQTYQHLQDVDIEPYVSKMLGTGKLGFTIVRITCLLVSSYRLWIGTSNGVIISVPLSGEYPIEKIVHSTDLPNASTEWECVSPVPTTGFIPYCSLSHAQLSFHGHKTNVKFFVAVPGNVGSNPSSKPSSPTNSPVKNTNTMLVMSGGEGYIDFRIGDEDSDISTKGEVSTLEDSTSLMSHLIVWQVSTSKL